MTQNAVYDEHALRRLLVRWVARLDQRAMFLETFGGTRLEFILAAPPAASSGGENAAAAK